MANDIGKTWRLRERCAETPLPCALALGLYCAWWNMYHDEGFLFLPTLADQVASCVACFSGALVTGALVLLARRLLKPPLRDKARVRLGKLIVAQAALGMAFDASIAFPNPPLMAFLQLLVSCSFFLMLFALTAEMSSLPLPRIAFALFVALLVYGAAECAAWILTVLFPGLAIRLAAHYAILAGAATCALRAFKAPGARFALAAPCSADAPLKIPLPLILHVATYSFVFGLTHALASGVVPLEHEKLLPCYLGVVLAGILFFIVFAHDEHLERIWPRVRASIFPLTILSFLLLPLSQEGLVFVSVGVAECAMDTYFAFCILAVCVIARKTSHETIVVAAQGAVLVSIPLIVGVVCGDALKVLELTPLLYNALTIFAFMLVVAGTFWVGDDKRVSYVWGLEKKLTPKKYEDSLTAQRCLKASEEFGLTKREREILVLLAQGQTAASIAESNVISLYTVRTHVARIHRKMNVHTHQELLRVVSEMQP